MKYETINEIKQFPVEFIQRYNGDNSDILTKSVRIEVIRMVIIGDLNNGGNNCHASSKYITAFVSVP